MFLLIIIMMISCVRFHQLWGDDLLDLFDIFLKGHKVGVLRKGMR